MNEQLALYAIEGLQFIAKLFKDGKDVSALITLTDDQLTAMQADGNRAPTAEERAARAALLDQLAELPAQAG